MEYVYAVVRNQIYRDIDTVYTNKDVAKEICCQKNDRHWEAMDTPIEYRREIYAAYIVVTIPVDSGEPF